MFEDFDNRMELTKKNAKLAEFNDIEWSLKKLRSESGELVNAINDLISSGILDDNAFADVLEESVDVWVMINRVFYQYTRDIDINFDVSRYMFEMAKRKMEKALKIKELNI